MILDRLETLTAISFIDPVIPKSADSGRNCLFIRVEGDKLILTGGNDYVVKKAVLIAQNTTEEAAREAKKTKLPERFMIPRADLLSFKEMMSQHKADCKKMAKNDQSYLFVEITDDELVSHDGRIIYQQPSFEFKKLEPLFDVKMGSVSEMPMMSADISNAVSGFRKSEEVEVTFTGHKKPVLFAQDDFESIVIPPVEKKEGEQLEIEE